PSLPGHDAVRYASLFGRTEHDDLAAQVGAEIDQVAEVLGSSLTHDGIRMRQVQPFGLRQHPVNAGDGDAGARCRVTDSQTLARGDGGDVIGDGEGGDFHGVITAFGGTGEGVFEFPSLENLVADGEFHWWPGSRGYYRTRRSVPKWFTLSDPRLGPWRRPASRPTSRSVLAAA